MFSMPILILLSFLPLLSSDCLSSFPGASIVPRRGRQGPKDYAPEGRADEKEKLEKTMEEFQHLHLCQRIMTQLVGRKLDCGRWNSSLTPDIFNSIQSQP